VWRNARPDDRPEDRAADAERELEEFSYIVSHDLAAACRHVAEFSRLLLGELGEDLTSRQKSHVDRIRTATDKSQLMMEQLLSFSRVQQKTLDKVWQDPLPALRLAMAQLALVEAAGVELTVEPLGEVYADPGLLALTFHHLLDITVRPAHDEHVWRMQIADNGLGVEPAYRDKAFGMFRRLNGESAYPGVGAGLAICRRVARRHGGEVRFLDCAEGACVELALPRPASLS
jgi:light-regulated signal transduction histidine kinase (bacteriophytochrome)